MLRNPTGVRTLLLWLACWSGSCYLLHSAAVDGIWSEWSPWGSCSASCGQGERMRIRACDPAPKNGGKWCPGKYKQKENCNFEAKCPVNGGWSSWASWTMCSVSCGEGSMRRFRSCSNPFPENGGTACKGSPQEVDRCVAMKECPRDGKWSSWSMWSQCSVTCGRGGSVHRYRSCNNPTPAGDGKNCEGTNQETQPCQAPMECPVNGQWSEWTKWTPCSVTCGKGDRERRRGCDNPPPNHGGRDCDRTEAGEVQTESCSGGIEHCPVDGGWSQWGAWGSCNTPKCGSTDVPARSFRQRSCNSPLPEHSGAMCQGTFLEAGLCAKAGNCRVDGNWGEWSGWTCSKFMVQRRRKCDNPPPSKSGQKCKGLDVDFIPREDEFFKKSCPVMVADDEDLQQGSGGFGSGNGMDDEDRA